MGFFREPGDGGDYITKEEKATLAEQEREATFTVTGVKFLPGQGYKGGDKYDLYIQLDGEERTLSFGAGDVKTRDQDLDGLIAAFESGQVTGLDAFLVKKGQAFFIQDAE